jgi:hypothetical protein
MILLALTSVEYLQAGREGVWVDCTLAADMFRVWEGWVPPRPAARSCAEFPWWGC